MNKNIFKNTANFIVFVRVLLVFVIVALFNSNSLTHRITGLVFLLLITVMDWFDGYVARTLKITSNVGGLLDTLGDRITENVLLIFLAYKHLVPVWIPLIFIARSFMADFIRHLTFKKGMDTFSVNKSKLGFYLVASKTSRAAYLLSKIFIFALGGIVLITENVIAKDYFAGADYLRVISVFVTLKMVLLYASVFLVIFNLVRFALLVYDSRFILKENFK